MRMPSNIIAGTKATRMELLALKKRKQLAQKGYDLLKEKRDALILEFFRLIEDVKTLRDSVKADLDQAFSNLKAAKMVDGPFRLYELSASIKPTISLDIEAHNVMGVKMPLLNILSKEQMDAQHSLQGFSSKTDDARKYFSKALETLIKLAEIEGSVKRLAEEIEKSKRRVNALKSIVIPRFEASINYIELHLEESEREDFSRLKFIKKKMSG